MSPSREKGWVQGGQAQKRPGGSVRPPLPREFIAQHKQRRIMDALAELTAEQGYEATKISDIVKRAGVARKTLYDNFEGKEEVFLVAFDAARDEVLRRVQEATADDDEDWQNGVEAGLAALPASRPPGQCAPPQSRRAIRVVLQDDGNARGQRGQCQYMPGETQAMHVKNVRRQLAQQFA